MHSSAISKKAHLFSVSILYFLLIIHTTTILAQSSFTRNDNYDFSGKHYLRVGGNDLDNFNIFIESTSDFHKNFKLRIIKSRLDIYALYFAHEYRIDMNNDGTWEQGWTTAGDLTVSFSYPDPTNGISQNHTIKVEINFANALGQTGFKRTKYFQITLFSTPRVYVNSEYDSFIQLRDEDCSSKIPILLVEGFDPLNENFPEKYYNLTWELVNSDLYPNGYEVFILNFNDGGRDLALNANVVLKCLEKIHQLCPDYQIALAGLSMGGLISRYALSKKESQSENHQVGLFLSYDSPQDGAHINPELQDWIKGQSSSEDAIEMLQDNLNSVAAKQMLRYNTYDQSHSYRNAFFNELNQFNGDGYPNDSYNVAIANGNMDATWGYSDVGRDLLTLKINDNLAKEVSAVEYDCGTGSKITDITMTRYGDIFSNPFIEIYYELSMIFNPVFIPTWSGLDLVNTLVDPITGDINSYDYSKFDDFEVQLSPLEHHQLSTLSRSVLMNWLDLDFDITTSYSLFNGGSISADNYQVNILHGKSINVQQKNVTVNGRSLKYNFYEWDDGNTTNPRTFYTSHDITRTANMKAHLASNNFRATGYNNGRRITWGNGDLHFVYEDGGEIWYTRSDDEGETWIPEVCISNIASSIYSSHHNPSLTELNNEIFVVWEGITDDEGNYPQPLRNILFRKADISGETTIWVNQIKEVGYNIVPNEIWCVGPDIAKPVICTRKKSLQDWELLVAWRACPPDSDPLSYAYITYGNLEGGFVDPVKIPGCYAFPVIGADNFSDSYPFVVVWSDWGNQIKSISGTYSGNDWNWLPAKVLNGNNPLDNYSDLSLSLDYGHIAYITWEADNLSANGNKELWYGSYDLAEANPQMSLIRVEDDGGPCDPVISINGSTKLPSIYYSRYGAIIRYRQSTNNRWNQQGFLAGDFPNTCVFGGSGAVWSSYHDAPYLIKNDYLEQVNPSPLPVKIPLKPIITYTYAIATAGSDTGYITLKLNKLDFNNETITFADPLESDTIIAPVSVIPMELEMEVTTCNLNSNPAAQDVLFKVDFIDGAQTIPLTNLRYHEIPDTSIVFTKSITANNLHYREGFLRFGFANLEPYSYFTLAEDDTTGLAKESAFEFNVIPERYSLSQNYPNPFNPLTYITFSLPVENEVSLDVYNINGQKVKELISGKRPAGMHQVIFNGSELSSGVYFYRLSAGNFIDTKRMLLIK